MSSSLDDVGVRLKVDDDATTPLQRIREGAKATTTSLLEMSAADPVLAGVSESLNKVALSAERASATLDQLSLRGTTALASTAASTDSLSSSMSNLDRHLDKASSTALGFFGGLTKYGAAAFAGLTAAAGYFGVTAASSFDQTRVAFSTMLGSVSAGSDLFKQLQTFNLQTPFGLPDLNKAEQTLLQYGMGQGQSVQVLKTLANVAAVGTDPTNDLSRSALAIGQISSAGVIRGQDLNQLTQAGFPAMRLLQQITGQSGRQIQQQLQGGGIQLPAGALVNAIAGGSGSILTPYADAARQQSLTLRGQASNFKDTVRSDLADASAPLGAQLLQTLPQLTTAVHELLTVAGPPVFAFLGDLLHGFTGLLPVLQPILTGLSQGLHEFLTALGPGARDLIPVGQQLGEAFHELFADLAGHGDDLSQLMVGLIGLLPEMVHILDDLIPLIDLFVKGLSGLLDFGPSRDVMAGLLVALLGYKALSGTIGAITGMATALRGLAAAEAEEAEASSLSRGGGFGKGAAGVLGLGGVVAGGVTGYHAGTSGGGTPWGSLAEGAGGGALAGATIGSVVPVLGTGVGALLGGAIGFGAAGASYLAGSSHNDGSGGVPHSQIWDPSKPGYGGYGTQPAGVIDNSKVADTVVIQGLTQDQATQALLDYNEQRARRK